MKAKKAAGWIDIPVPESRIDIPEEKPDYRPDLLARKRTKGRGEAALPS